MLLFYVQTTFVDVSLIKCALNLLLNRIYIHTLVFVEFLFEVRGNLCNLKNFVVAFYYTEEAQYPFLESGVIKLLLSILRHYL